VSPPVFFVRRASVDDAHGITGVLREVVAERVHSAIDRAWTDHEQRTYLASLAPREAFHVAISAGQTIGYQSLDLYSPTLTSTTHVAQLGTFVISAWRGRGVGQALFQATKQFAESSGYRKIVIQVRASNAAAQRFYTSLGFVERCRLSAQVVIDGQEDDEIIMELLLSKT
jgi:L-amino acid N-acyltransferase YncA